MVYKGHLFRRPRVMDITGMGRSSLYFKIDEGIFPPPIAIGPRSVAWVADEVYQITGAMINGRTKDELRKLVSELIQKRSEYESYGMERTV